LLDPDDPKEDPFLARRRRERWLRIPGKHKTREDAWRALQDAMATRH
jgi:hypothetical protein